MLDCALFDLFYLQLQRVNIIYTMNGLSLKEGSQTTMTKVIILDYPDLSFSQSFQANIPYHSNNRELDLGYSIHHILHNTLQLTSPHQVFYFHPGQQLFEFVGLYPFKYPLLIGEDFIGEPQISVKIRKVMPQTEHIEEGNKEIKEVLEKKKRLGPRTIRQVLQKVSEWRQLSHKNPKITLEEGAKIVGVPKKTLDDYYAHIKLGSEYNFGFKMNLQQKIGVLRSFVRQNNAKKKQGGQFQFLDNILKHQGESDQQQQQQE